MNARTNLHPTPAPKSRLELAREAHDSILSKLNTINVEAAKVEANAATSPATGAAQSLRQQRTGILSRMLRSGRVEANSPDVKAIEKQLLGAEDAERQAAAIAEARVAALAELQAEAAPLLAELAAARRELEVARFEAAGEDIRNRLIPAYLAAADHMRDAYAALAGAGRAHYQLAAELNDAHGLSVGPLGQPQPATDVAVSPVPAGFGVSNNGGFNVLRFDVSAAMYAAQTSAVARWRSA